MKKKIYISKAKREEIKQRKISGALGQMYAQEMKDIDSFVEYLKQKNYFQK